MRISRRDQTGILLAATRCMRSNTARSAIMHEATPTLENSHPTATPTQERPGVADYDAGGAPHATPHVYKTLPNRPIRRNFMDFFAPARRQPHDQSVPTYKALTEPPADPAEIAENPEMPQTSDIQPSEFLDAPEIMEAQTEQSIKRAISLG
jgi:hypothetical protein